MLVCSPPEGFIAQHLAEAADEHEHAGPIRWSTLADALGVCQKRSPGPLFALRMRRSLSCVGWLETGAAAWRAWSGVVAPPSMASPTVVDLRRLSCHHLLQHFLCSRRVALRK